MLIGFGIDGGATHSGLVLFNAQTKERLLALEGGPGNPHSIGLDKAWENIQTLIKQGLETLQLSEEHLACGCLAGAGLGREREQAAFSDFFSAWLNCPVRVCTDGEALLAGSLNSLHGYALIAGTGSLALGRNGQGHLVRAGGLGHMLGDEGSASWIGWQAVKRALKSRERRDLKTNLLPALQEHFGLSDPQGFVDWFHQQFDKSRVAAVAPLVLSAAAGQDALAMNIVESAAQVLFGLVQSVMLQMPLSTPQLALGGGLLERDNLLRRQLLELIFTSTPQVKLAYAKEGDAAWGACLMALETLGHVRRL
ncbi:MAG: BadF/BadG/BcrA/BcrD ATPase family protein [Bacillota bacterium]|nr:BadF/BadG/BcrA/BcrD ATPase family protein [Bacillota bacterium]